MKKIHKVLQLVLGWPVNLLAGLWSRRLTPRLALGLDLAAPRLEVLSQVYLGSLAAARADLIKNQKWEEYVGPGTQAAIKRNHQGLLEIQKGKWMEGMSLEVTLETMGGLAVNATPRKKQPSAKRNAKNKKLRR